MFSISDEDTYRHIDRLTIDDGYQVGGSREVELHLSPTTTERPGSTMHGWFLGALYALAIFALVVAVGVGWLVIINTGSGGA